MSKECLILVPHPDDEINIAGDLMPLLHEAGYRVTVAYSTAGDHHTRMTSVRVRELFEAQKVLGYEQVILLGYGDLYKDTNIYTDDYDRVIEAPSGRRETYNIDGHPSYHFSRTGEHAPYCRRSMLSDIKALICERRPALLICVDVDKHPDHRLLSLLFDEAMGEILHECADYHPVVLKRFAYVGVFKGRRDYFHRPMLETQPSHHSRKDPAFVYPYDWSDRICLPTPLEHYPLEFWKSPLYQALRAHKSQHATKYLFKICNSDIVCFYRPTGSLTYSASISVSSGEREYLNDFKVVEVDDVRVPGISLEPSPTKAWIPSTDDPLPTITVTLSVPSRIQVIRLYRSKYSAIHSVCICTDTGYRGEFLKDTQSIQAEDRTSVQNVSGSQAESNVGFQTGVHTSGSRADVYKGTLGTGYVLTLTLPRPLEGVRELKVSFPRGSTGPTSDGTIALEELEIFSDTVEFPGL